MAPPTSEASDFVKAQFMILPGHITCRHCGKQVKHVILSRLQRHIQVLCEKVSEQIRAELREISAGSFESNKASTTESVTPLSIATPPPPPHELSSSRLATGPSSFPIAAMPSSAPSAAGQSSASGTIACQIASHPSRTLSRTASNQAAGSSHSVAKAAKPIKRQKTLAGFVDTFTRAQQVSLEDDIAKWIYGTGLSLSTTSQGLFKKMMAKARPGFKVPSAKKLGTNLLEKHYAIESKRLEDIVAKASRIAILSDGWTSQTADNLINYILIIDGKSYFKEVTMTGSEAHNAENMARDFRRVIDSIGPEKVIGITTDNAGNMVKSVRLLKETHPRVIGLGCASHKMNLLAGDICGLPSMADVLDHAVKVTKFFKTRPKFSHALKVAAGNQYLALQNPGLTRWQGKFYCVRAVAKNYHSIKIALLELTEADPTLVSKQFFSDMKGLIDSNGYKDRMDRFMQVIRPVLQATIRLETDRPMFGQVCPILSQLQHHLQESIEHDAKIAEIFEKRREQILHPLMALGYLADPIARAQFGDSIISGTDITDTAKWILENYYGSNKFEAGAFMAFMRALQARESPFDDDLLWESYRNMALTKWWDQWLLSKWDAPERHRFVELCQIVLSLPPTTGGAERNWSIFGFVHSKLRNRLKQPKVAKLVFLHSMLKEQNVSRFQDRRSPGVHEVESAAYEDPGLGDMHAVAEDENRTMTAAEQNQQLIIEAEAAVEDGEAVDELWKEECVAAQFA